MTTVEQTFRIKIRFPETGVAIHPTLLTGLLREYFVKSMHRSVDVDVYELPAKEPR
jgi:hypothetical protein